ncbi:MAG: ABC transporter transmembrane domain-containing protein, partial [Thalassotalea sp.]|nr:ABC transporter transmembrane domain-containing protein [Thalassotalea sp.]
MTNSVKPNTPNKQEKALKSLLPILAFIKPYKLMVFYALMALLVTSLVSLSIGQGVKFVIDKGFVAGSQSELQSSIFFLIGLVALLAIGTFCRFYLMSWLGERVSADIRKTVFNRLITLHPSYFEENRSGELMSRLTTDTTLLQSIIGSSFSMALRSLLMLVGALTMLLITNINLTMYILIGVPLALIPMIFHGKKVRKLASHSQDSIADIGTYAGEIIQNIKVVQSFTHENKEKLAFADEVEIAFDIAKRRIRQRSLLIASVIFLAFSAISVMLWSGGRDVISGAMSAGDLGAFVFYAIMLAMSVGTIAEVYGELQRAAGSATRLLELMSVDSEINDPSTPTQMPDNKENIIEFKQLKFNYPSRPDVSALNNINLT